MTTYRTIIGIATASLSFLTAAAAPADVFNFSTGDPDGLIGTLSRPGTGGALQTETADDFILNTETILTSATDPLTTVAVNSLPADGLLIGGAGDDVLIGGPGQDTLNGAPDNDTWIQ